MHIEYDIPSGLVNLLQKQKQKGTFILHVLYNIIKKPQIDNAQPFCSVTSSMTPSK